MPDLNYHQIIGHVGQEPELRFTTSGMGVASFSVAVNEVYTSNGEKKENTDWFNVVVWGKLAEICNRYVTKGMLVYVAGNTKLNQWETSEGQQRSKLELRANKVLFLSKSGNKSEPEPELEDNPF